MIDAATERHTLFVEPQNGQTKRLVMYRDIVTGEEVHRDCIDVNIAFLRENFQKAVKKKLRGDGSENGIRIRPKEVIISGIDPLDSIAEDILWAAVEADKAKAASGTDKVVYQQLTCAQLDAAEYLIEYIVETLVVAGQPLIFAGAKKTLKTNLLIALAFALATGTDFLGKFRVNRAVRVAMMSGESGLATIQETARRIAAAAGWELADVQNLIFSPDLPVFGDLYHVDALRLFLTENEIEFLIIDPAYLAIPADGQEGSLFAIGKLLRAMAEVCQSVGVTMCLAHHTKKSVADPFQPVELEDISWAGFQEFARQWVLVSRRQKYEPGTGEHLMWMNVGGSAGHSSLWGLDIREGVFDGHTPRHWDVDVLRAEDVRQQAKEVRDEKKQVDAQGKADARLEVNKKRILAAISKYPDGESSNIIETRSGMNTAYFRVAFADLLNDDVVVECGTVKKANGHVYPAYKLAPTET